VRSFLAPESRHRGQASWRRKDSPDHQTARGFERGQRRPGMGEIPSFPGRAQDGHRAHDGQRDCVGRASRRQHHGRLSSPKAMHQMPSICMGPQAAKFAHLGWPACINIAKCLQLVRTAESLRQRRSWARISLAQIPTVRLTLSPYLTCLVPLIGFGSGVLRENAEAVRPEGDAGAAGHTGRTSNEIQTRLDDAGRRPAPGREWGWGVGGHQ
jgi:hypothetical protein